MRLWCTRLYADRTGLETPDEAGLLPVRAKQASGLGDARLYCSTGCRAREPSTARAASYGNTYYCHARRTSLLHTI
jgi:hypothetical protein